VCDTDTVCVCVCVWRVNSPKIWEDAHPETCSCARKPVNPNRNLCAMRWAPSDGDVAVVSRMMLMMMRAFDRLLLVILAVQIAVSVGGSSSESSPGGRKVNADVVLPLKTRSRWIVDQNDNVVKLACVNWYGAHMEEFVVNGLDAQTIDTIAGNIAGLGFNCVRFPFSTELITKNPLISNATSVAANLELLNSDAISIVDAVIASLTSKGLFVILNNHIGKAQWCCSETDGEGLWYSDTFSTAEFESSWKYLANKYVNNKYIIGADLRNELRASNLTKPTWGSGVAATDWALEATAIGNSLLNIASDWLIIVEGIDYSTNLKDVKNAPIKLAVANRLVYSPHDYSWSQPLSSYAQFSKLLDNSWGYIVTEGQPYTAPLWLGEFGTDTSDNWWAWIRQYITEKELSWCYWALDGEKYVGVDETFGLYMQDYVTIRHPWKVADLQALMV
jgi:endoglucanase